MIREYTGNDKLEIIELFRKNTPKYFDGSEVIVFENYHANPHYSLNLLKMRVNSGYPDIVKPNFGSQNWLH
jgi:hypothetical protein